MKTQFRELHAQWYEYWQSRVQRERLVLGATAAVLVIGFSVWVVQVMERSRAELRISVPELRARAGLLEQQAIEFERLRAAPALPAAQTDMRALVQAQTAAAGLSRALVSTETADANLVKVVFGAVAFADWLNLVVNLEAQRVHLDACRIESLSTPGLVSVTATFTRPQPR